MPTKQRLRFTYTVQIEADVDNMEDVAEFRTQLTNLGTIIKENVEVLDADSK